MSDDNRKGLGDDQGTRVGSPSPGSTGAGSEASEGIHSADGDRSENDKSALEGKKTGRTDGDTAQKRAGSEPIESHDTEHRSKYGGGSRRENGEGQRS